MNDIEFTAMARNLPDGAIISLTRSDSSTATGILLRFIDPAKPILLYRQADTQNRLSTGLRVDFLQDVVYTPAVQYSCHSITVYTADGEHRPQNTTRVWELLSGATGLALDNDSTRYDAYAEGMLQNAYPIPQEHGFVPGNVTGWTEYLCRLCGMTSDRLSRICSHHNLQEERNDYRSTLRLCRNTH